MTTLPEADEAITEEWLNSVGFKWHQFDRQPDKHWLLWLGAAIPDTLISFDDIGLELAPRWWKNRHGDDIGQVGSWHCWLRGDTSHRYSRFIHVRPLKARTEIITMVEALSGQPWNPENHYGGMVYQPRHREQIRRDLQRFDHELRESRPKWHEIEKDDSRGRALPEHIQAQADALKGGEPDG